MTPNTDPIQFPRQIWQTVSDHARQCLTLRDFCPDHSRIENLRCVSFDSEKETKYGSQVWQFEAIGIDPRNRRHMLYGALQFSVQYGLLELEKAEVFQDVDQRQRFFHTEEDHPSSVWSHASTRFWVRMACLGVVVSAMIWCTSLLMYLTSQ